MSWSSLPVSYLCHAYGRYCFPLDHRRSNFLQLSLWVDIHHQSISVWHTMWRRRSCTVHATRLDWLSVFFFLYVYYIYSPTRKSILTILSYAIYGVNINAHCEQETMLVEYDACWLLTFWVWSPLYNRQSISSLIEYTDYIGAELYPLLTGPCPRGWSSLLFLNNVSIPRVCALTSMIRKNTYCKMVRSSVFGPVDNGSSVLLSTLWAMASP